LELDIYNILLLLAVGIIAGGLNTLAGGGSLLSLPVLIFLGLPPNVANATNRVAIFCQNIFAVRGFKSKGVSAYPYSLWLGISAFFGAILGATFAVDIKGETFNKILAIVIIFVIGYMAFGKKAHVKGSEKTDKKSTIIGIITFFFIGIYGGFIQAGVGYIIIASLSFINHFPLVKTNSAKVFVVLIYTISSLGIFIYNGLINWEMGLSLAVGNATGGWLASRWSTRIDEKWVRYLVMVTATVFAVKLFFF
jgi:uncharacterized membrane protein YfcA